MTSDEILLSIMVSLLPKQIVGHYLEQDLTEIYTLTITDDEIYYELDDIRRMCYGTKRGCSRHHETMAEAALYLLKDLIDTGYIKSKQDKSFVNNWEKYFIAT